MEFGKKLDVQETRTRMLKSDSETAIRPVRAGKPGPMTEYRFTDPLPSVTIATMRTSRVRG